MSNTQLAEIKKKGANWLCNSGCSTASSNKAASTKSRSSSVAKRGRDDGESSQSKSKKQALLNLGEDGSSVHQTAETPHDEHDTHREDQTQVIAPGIESPNRFEHLMDTNLANEVIDTEQSGDTGPTIENIEKAVVSVQRQNGEVFNNLNINLLCDELLQIQPVGVLQPFFTKDRKRIMIPVTSKAAKDTLLGIKEICKIPVESSSRESETLKEKIKYRIEGVDITYSEEELNEALKEQGVAHAARVTYIDRGVRKNSNKVMLTFESETIPKKIKLGFNAHAVTSFREPKRCYRCLSYDHTIGECAELHRLCGQCGASDHLRKECKNDPKCASCQGPHKAGASVCQERKNAIIRETRRLAISEKAKPDPPVPLPVVERIVRSGTEETPAPNQRGSRLYSAVVLNGIRVQSNSRSTRGRSHSVRQRAKPRKENTEKANGQATHQDEPDRESLIEELVAKASNDGLKKITERLDTLERAIQQFESLERVVNKLEKIVQGLIDTRTVKVSTAYPDVTNQMIEARNPCYMEGNTNAISSAGGYWYGQPQPHPPPHFPIWPQQVWAQHSSNPLQVAPTRSEAQLTDANWTGSDALVSAQGADMTSHKQF
jgi:hypothetical protein